MNGQFAVLDLGSNSFRLLVARRQGEFVQLVERAKEKVQLMRNFREGRLDDAALARATQCLRRFAQRVSGLSRDRVVMVGTHALREGSNRAELVEAAEAIVGVPLRILSGEEEAALIYRGVQMRERPDRIGSRLVIDVGGGSTEFAWGAEAAPSGVLSCAQGCVSLADRFFGTGLPLGPALAAARAHLEASLPALDPVGRDVEVIGTSGTIESIQTVLVTNGWSDREITAAGLAHLIHALRDGRFDPRVGLLGLAPERVDIFPAGVALIDALFRHLGIDVMKYVDAALEDGVLYGMLADGRAPGDAREIAVRGLQARHGIDVRQARRVRRTALALFDQASAWWSDGPGGDVSASRRLLGFAADLHEIGLVIAPRGYHRHGAYMLRYTDLQGFSAAERERLALLVRCHRRGMPVLAFSGLATDERRRMVRLAALLRIAVILERSHAVTETPAVQGAAWISDQGDRLTVRLPPGWLDDHLLSRRELEVETAQLAAAGIGLEIIDG